MGNSTPPKIIYAKPISKPIMGESSVYRDINHLDTLASEPAPGIDTYTKVYQYAFKEYPNSPFLGRRVVKPDGSLDDQYTWETYSEIEELGQKLGSGIQLTNIVAEKAQWKNYKLKFIALYAGNTREWALVDVASALYGYTLIPIYDTLGEEATEFMFKETEVSCLFLTCNHVKAMAEGLKAGKFPHLKTLVIMDEANLTDELKSSLESVNHFTLNQLISKGAASIQPYVETKPEEISFFSYTSGTTGTPKGAMVTHANLCAGIYGVKVNFPDTHMRHLSYLPLAHCMERLCFALVIFRGGEYGFFGGDVKKLTEDLAILKPTLFLSVPRLFSRFFDVIQGKFAEKTGFSKWLINKAVAAKLENLRTEGTYTHMIYDALVFNKLKAILGGNVEYILTGSAPISSEVREFLKIAFCAPFVEGYGQTEAVAGEFITKVEDHLLGHVGGPMPQNETKVVDVPNMNYFSTDQDEEGNLTPRGEICVRGPNVIPGYFKNEAKTKEMIDQDGWLHSGDIGMILPNGTLKIIDRLKNIFKLSQGEYVAPDKLEQIYQTVTGITEILVYGESTQSCLIGVIYPEPADLEQIAVELNIVGQDFQDLCKNDDVNAYFVESLKNKTRSANLKGFERIKRLYISDQTFESLGLLTTTFKMKRQVAKQHFKEILTNLYVGLD